MRDIIDCGKFSVVRLSRIFRQGERSQIVSVAHRILSGDCSIDGISCAPLNFVNPNDDIVFIPTETPEECVHSSIELIKNKIPKWYGLDSIADVQILVPMHKGTGGIATFNYEMKKAFNSGNDALSYGGTTFAVGDKIMQTRNNYDLDIFNGDMGTVVSVARDSSGIVADFDGKRIVLSKSDLIDFQQAYAVSIHKSQGSEFPVVVIPLLRQHFIMLQRNLLYTAITRGRRKVFVVGNQSAWAVAVKNLRSSTRKTFLKTRLEKL